MIRDIIYNRQVTTVSRHCLSLRRTGLVGPPGKMGRGRGVLPALCLLVAGLLLAACSGRQTARPTVGAPTQGPAGEVQATAALATQAPAARATATPTITPTPTPPAPLAAQVNGQYIFLTDYERRVSQYEQALADQGLDPGLAREEVLEGLIDGALIQQGAATLGIELGDEELDRQVEADIAAGGGQAAFDKWLQATGQSREDYREMLRQSLIVQRAMEAVTAEVPAVAEQVHARHIQVDSEEAAREILAQLQGGADFAALARERSTDMATRDNGGDLGWFPRGVVAAELESVAFALQPGQVSDVLPLGEGFHLIQVVEREVARALPDEMHLELQQAAFERWLAELRAAATIVRFAAE
jgi:parvulin-like peptidyl-prolyl isomerase